jgi:hypothetical protein
LQSKNEVIQFVNRQLAAQQIPYPTPAMILEELKKTLEQNDMVIMP